MQFADPARFQVEVQTRPEYQRLLRIDGKEVEAELYQLPDGKYRAGHARVVYDSARTDSHGQGGGGVTLEPLLPSASQAVAPVNAKARLLAAPPLCKLRAHRAQFNLATLLCLGQLILIRKRISKRSRALIITCKVSAKWAWAVSMPIARRSSG